MKRKQLFNYTLSNVYLNKCKSFFKFILMLARDINLNPGSITTIHNSNMWNDLPFCNCNVSVDRTEHQFNIDSNNSNSGDN